MSPRSQAEQIRATATSAAADADRSRANYVASQQQEAVVAQSRGQLLAGVARARAALSLANQNLEHSVIRAPVAGVVGDRQVQTGNMSSPARN